MGDLPATVQVLLQTKIALQRIVDLLNMDEVEEAVEPGVEVEATTRMVRGDDVGFKHATITWPAKEGKKDGLFRLRHVNLTIPPGLTLVCGPLGSGKTLLVSLFSISASA